MQHQSWIFEKIHVDVFYLSGSTRAHEVFESENPALLRCSPWSLHTFKCGQEVRLNICANFVSLNKKLWCGFGIAGGSWGTPIGR